jgi:hypothetical protein
LLFIAGGVIAVNFIPIVTLPLLMTSAFLLAKKSHNEYKNILNLSVIYNDKEKENKDLMINQLIGNVICSSKDKENNNNTLKSVKNTNNIYFGIMAGLGVMLGISYYPIIKTSLNFLLNGEVMTGLSLLNTPLAPVALIGGMSASLIASNIFSKKFFEKKININNSIIDENKELLKSLIKNKKIPNHISQSLSFNEIKSLQDNGIDVEVLFGKENGKNFSSKLKDDSSINNNNHNKQIIDLDGDQHIDIISNNIKTKKLN